eukprot:403364940
MKTKERGSNFMGQIILFLICLCSKSARLQQYCEGQYPLVFAYNDLINDGETFFNVIESYQDNLIVGGRTNDYQLYINPAALDPTQSLFRPLIAIIKKFDTKTPELSQSFVYEMHDYEITDIEIDTPNYQIFASVQDITKTHSLQILRISLQIANYGDVLTVFIIQSEKPLINYAQSMILSPKELKNRLYIQGTYDDRFIVIGFYNINDQPQLNCDISIRFQSEVREPVVKQAISNLEKQLLISVGHFIRTNLTNPDSLADINYGFFQVINFTDETVFTYYFQMPDIYFTKLYIDNPGLVAFAGYDKAHLEIQVGLVSDVYLYEYSYEPVQIFDKTFTVLGQKLENNVYLLVAYKFDFSNKRYSQKDLKDMSMSLDNYYTDMRAFKDFSFYYVGQGYSIGQYPPTLELLIPIRVSQQSVN